MITKKIANLSNGLIKTKNDVLPPSHPDLLQPYFRLNVSSCSGSGKTNAILNMLSKQYPYYDKIFLISPTINNDPKAKDFFSDKPNVYIYDDPKPELINEIRSIIKEDIKKHEEYKDIKKLWAKFKKGGYNPDKIEPYELMKLYSVNFDPSSHEMANDNDKLNNLLFFEDCQDMDILKCKDFSNLTIKARHSQLSLICCTQNWKAVTNTWRRNATAHFIFKTHDKNLIKQIFEEVALFFPNEEVFNKIYEYCTKDPYCFMYIDTKDNLRPIRKNFDEVILMDQFKKEENGSSR